MMMQGILPGFKSKGPEGPIAPTPITLEFWNVFEDEDVYSEQLADYKTLYPHITINYTKVHYIEYR